MKPSKQANAAKWMLEGIKQHQKFLQDFQSAKEDAFNAGLFFLSAKAEMEHGDWELFKQNYADKIPPRSLERYCEFATEVLAWAREENPKLVSVDQLQGLARSMVLQSPKGMVALCRELKLMRRFGEYDAVKYASRKMLGAGGQIEFDFTSAEKTLQMLCDPKVQLTFPEGTDELAALTELDGTLKSAHLRVSRRLNELRKTVQI
jgi:hypothetical protein